MFDRIANNTSALAWASISKGSHVSYQTGMNHWISFTKRLGTDPFIQEIPAVFLARDLFILSFIETVVVGFMMYLRYDRHVTPDTIAQYLSAVRFHLAVCGIDAVHTKSAQISRVFAGLRLEWLKEPGNSKAERQHLAFTPDMIRKMGQTLDLRDDRQFATFMAVRTQFQFLMRVGELVFTSNNQDHCLKGKSVMFVLRPTNGPGAQQQTIGSSSAYLYTIADIEAVIVDVKDAKNDPEGMGFRYQLNKRTPEQLAHEDAFCICTSLFECATRLRPSPDASFFQTTRASGARQWRLTDVDISKFIKSGAKLLSLDPERFTTHGPRIAGASALSQLGAPAWYIKLAGRWTTDQYLQYIRMASSSFEEFMGKMHSAINANDMYRWNPSMAATMPIQVFNA